MNTVLLAVMSSKLSLVKCVLVVVVDDDDDNDDDANLVSSNANDEQHDNGNIVVVATINIVASQQILCDRSFQVNIRLIFR
jgi:hypothetical protein